MPIREYIDSFILKWWSGEKKCIIPQQEINPFKKSRTNTKLPADAPIVRLTLVAPGLPLPISKMFLL